MDGGLSRLETTQEAWRHFDLRSRLVTTVHGFFGGAIRSSERSFSMPNGKIAWDSSTNPKVITTVIAATRM